MAHPQNTTVRVLTPDDKWVRGKGLCSNTFPYLAVLVILFAKPYRWRDSGLSVLSLAKSRSLHGGLSTTNEKSGGCDGPWRTRELYMKTRRC